MEIKTEPKTKFVGTLLGVLIAVTAISGVIILSTSHFLTMAQLSLFLRAPPEKKFMTAWAADIKHLDGAKYLPAGFHNLKSVRLFSPSAKIKKIFYQYPLGLATSPQGKFNLEIFADEIDEGGVVVQYDLVDIASGNTVWELGRTFPQNLGGPAAAGARSSAVALPTASSPAPRASVAPQAALALPAPSLKP